MFVCTEPRLTTWTPDYPSSAWTRVSCGDVELCNSLNSAWFDENPVQVKICEACGHVRCASGGYVHITRLGEFVLWTTAQEEEDYDAQYYPAAALRKLGAVAFPAEVWDSTFPTPAAVFGRANHRAALDAWMLGPGRSHDPRELVPMLRERLLAGDTLSIGRAIEIVSSLLDELLANAYKPFERRIVNAADVGARIEKLCFDGPEHEDWFAFAFIGDTPHLALTRNLVAIAT